MADHKSNLCIGGPLAGQRKAIMYGTKFMVAESLATHVRKIEYRRETFAAPEGEVSVWVPDGQTLLETMRLLLEGYERSARSKSAAGEVM